MILIVIFISYLLAFYVGVFQLDSTFVVQSIINCNYFIVNPIVGGAQKSLLAVPQKTSLCAAAWIDGDDGVGGGGGALWGQNFLSVSASQCIEK